MEDRRRVEAIDVHHGFLPLLLGRNLFPIPPPRPAVRARGRRGARRRRARARATTLADRPGATDEYEERRLERIIGVVRLASTSRQTRQTIGPCLSTSAVKASSAAGPPAARKRSSNSPSERPTTVPASNSVRSSDSTALLVPLAKACRSPFRPRILRVVAPGRPANLTFREMAQRQPDALQWSSRITPAATLRPEPGDCDQAGRILPWATANAWMTAGRSVEEAEAKICRTGE